MTMGGRIWDDVVPESERRAYQDSGLGASAGLGARPALLVVDVSQEFTGDRDAPVEELRSRFPLACGPAAWRALPRIRALLDIAREKGMPVFYTRQAPRPTAIVAGAWALKSARVLDASTAPSEELLRIP